MKTKIFTILVLLVFLVGCGQKAEQPAEEGEEAVGEEAGETAEKEPPVIEPTEEVKEMTEDVKELLTRASKKVKSYSYYYYGPETQIAYNLLIKGNKTKIIPPENVKVRENEFYDTIYLNTETKTALAYCESLDTLICPDTSKEFTLSYNGVYLKTPMDWLNEIKYAERLSEETIQERKTIKLVSGEVGTIWIEDYYGIPFQIEKGGKTYRFETVVFNQVKDSDVTH